jgi:hypothetical protein
VVDVRLHASIASIAEADWDALDGASAPFLRWRWLDALERTGCVGGESGWTPHHLTFHEAGRLVAAAPAYLKDNSEGEFVFDHAWAAAAERMHLAYYPKLVVASPFTPATATKLLVARREDRPRLVPELAAALVRIVDAAKLSGAHVLFPPEEEARALAEAGFAHRYGVQFHWRNDGYASYDDFLGRFSAKRRHQLRRERRELERQGIAVETVRGADLDASLVDAMYGFYTSTVDKFVWGRRYLTRAFFDELGGSLRDGVEVVVARERSGGAPIAGALNLHGGGVLYGRYWGARQERPFLHFNVCYYHSIEECIARGTHTFEPGAGGEHKLVRGFSPTLTHSAHFLSNDRLDAAVRAFLGREREALREAVAEPGAAFR